MRTGRFIAYYRVSTARQGRSGLGLDAQREAVAQHLNGGSWELLGDYTEIESGRRNDRPELTKALAACRLHRATLVIAKLDRLARNVAFISNLMESSVEFEACDLPLANRLTVHVLAAVAEHEAQAISDRTRAALAAAKRRGTKLGGFRGRCATDNDRARARASRIELANRRAVDLAETIRAAQAEGATSLRVIAAHLNSLRIPTPGAYNKREQPTGRGGKWSAVQVSRVLARLQTVENRS